MTALVLTIGVGVLLGVAQAAHDHWFNDGWVEKVNAEVASKGLPEATHRKKRWGRTIALISYGEDGTWLWRAER